MEQNMNTKPITFLIILSLTALSVGIPYRQENADSNSWKMRNEMQARDQQMRYDQMQQADKQVMWRDTFADAQARDLASEIKQQLMDYARISAGDGESCTFLRM